MAYTELPEKMGKVGEEEKWKERKKEKVLKGKKKINTNGMDRCHCESREARDTDRNEGKSPGGWRP